MHRPSQQSPFELFKHSCLRWGSESFWYPWYEGLHR